MASSDMPPLDKGVIWFTRLAFYLHQGRKEFPL